MLRRRLTNNFGVNAGSCATLRLQSSAFSRLLFSSVPTFDSINNVNGRHSTNHTVSMTNLNFNSVMLAPRRTYHCRQLDTTVTVQRKDGKMYPALLSWNWNTQHPRHLVVKIAGPASTFRNASTSNKKEEESTLQTSDNVQSSANRSSDNNDMSKENRCNEGFTSESEENSSSASLPASSMTNDAQSANAQSDDPYFFGRLFLRVQNVAELLAVLIGWSPSAQIERERAGLMLRPTSFASQENIADGRTSSVEIKEIGGDGKNDIVAGKTCKENEKLQTLSNFTLTGYFTKKMKVDESNEKYIEQEEVAKQRNYAIHGRDENEEKSVYIDNELCTISVTLQASELMLLKNFLDYTMSNIFGIEHSYYRKVTEQVLEKQRKFLARRSYNNINNNNNNREVTTSYAPRYRSEMIDYSPHNRSTPMQLSRQMAAPMPRRNYPEELQQQQHRQQQEKERYLYEEEQMQRGGGSHYDGVAQVKEDYTRPFIIKDKASRAIANDKTSMTGKNEGNDNQNTLKEKIAPVQGAHVLTPVTEATADLTSELQNEENVDDLDHEMQQDDIDDSKLIEAEIDNICDEEYEEIDEDNGIDGEDDAGSDSQTIINKNSSIDNDAESNTAGASDDSAHEIKSNCEVIADEESVRDTDELDAEEVDADEQIEVDEWPRDDQEKTANGDEGNDDDEVNEKEWEISEEEEEVIDEDVAADAADKDQVEEEEQQSEEQVEEVEVEEIVEEVVEEEEEIGAVDQTKADNYNKEVSEGAKDKMCTTDKLDSVGKHETKQAVNDSQRSEEVDDEQNKLNGEQVRHERSTEAANDTQSAEEQSDMEIEEIEEVIEEEIEEVEDEADDVDDEHVKTMATSYTGNVAAEMNVDAQDNKFVNTSQTNTDSLRKTAHDNSMVEDVEIAADGSNVCATDTSLPYVNKSASMNADTNKHRTREHAAEARESDKNEPVMEVKTNAARTLATKVANIREQGASEVSTDEDIVSNSKQQTKPEAHHRDEKVVTDYNNLIRKHDNAAKKVNKANIVVPSTTKRSAKKNGHVSHTKKSFKKSKKKSKGDQRIIV